MYAQYNRHSATGQKSRFFLAFQIHFDLKSTDILYRQKFSPGENFCQFRHLFTLAKFFIRELFVLC